jgi:PAS domain S-box-containing protein
MLKRHDPLGVQHTAELAARERRFRLLAEHSQNVIFRYTLSPVPAFDYLSPAVEQVLGYPAAAFEADPGLLLRLVHPADRALFTLDATSSEARAAVLRLRHADGHWVWVEQRSSLVLDTAGQPVAVEG